MCARGVRVPARPEENSDWGLLVSRFRSPTAPLEVLPKVEVVEPAALTVEPTVPLAVPPTFAAVLVTPPTAPPAVEATPPTRPPPPEERAEPELLALPNPEPARSGASSEPDAIVSAAASAWMLAFSGTSWPFFRMALSNTMPSEDSDSPLPRAFASVTCPTSFEPLGITTSPSDLVFSVVLPVTVSPGLFFLQSTGLVRTAFIVVPCATLAEFWPACAEALPEVLFDAAAPDLLACADVLLSAEALA